jgi:hypothetical protein
MFLEIGSQHERGDAFDNDVDVPGRSALLSHIHSLAEGKREIYGPIILKFFGADSGIVFEELFL